MSNDGLTILSLRISANTSKIYIVQMSMDNPTTVGQCCLETRYEDKGPLDRYSGGSIVGKS